jgi:hypothetical protein
MTTKPAQQKILKEILHIEVTRMRQEDSRKKKPF